MQRTASILAIGAVLISSLWVSAGAQSRPQASPGGPHLTAGPTYTNGDGNGAPKFPAVDVVYTLAGADGAPIAAKADELKLFAEGKEIGAANAIRTFDKTGFGITAILALDASGSMRGAPINAIHASITRFVNQARPFDKVEVITFADQTQIDVPFGGSQEAIRKELETVQARGKFTRLYDGLLDALAQFNDSQPKRRQLVVISDGHDEGSKKAIADVVYRAKQLGVVIDCIGLTKDHGEYLNSLQTLAFETGGTYRRAMSAQELDAFIGQGIDATRSTPVASFTTTDLAADNTRHATELRWVPGKASATAFIQTPQGGTLETLKQKVRDGKFGNLWLWVLGACFVAGLILLVISWVGVKSKRKPMPVSAFPMTTPQGPMQPDAAIPPAAFSAGSGPSGRTPTLPETNSKKGPYQTMMPPVVTTIEPPAHLLAGDQAAVRERSRTKLAAFFEAPDAGPYALILPQGGELAGEAIPVTRTKFSLGATGGNDLNIPGDPTISGQHARLFWEGSILKIEDLQSTNGTYVNSLRLTPGRHLLRPGDEVRLGQTVLVVDRI